MSLELKGVVAFVFVPFGRLLQFTRIAWALGRESGRVEEGSGELRGMAPAAHAQDHTPRPSRLATRGKV